MKKLQYFCKFLPIPTKDLIFVTKIILPNPLEQGVFLLLKLYPSYCQGAYS